MGAAQRSIWASIAMIALAVFAPAATGLIASGVTGLLLTVAVVFAGGMIISRELAASQPDAPEGSQVYAWHPQTLQRAGGSLPKAYGRNRLHGNIIGCYTEEVNTLGGVTITKSEQRLNLLIDYGEGPVEGLVADSVLINGQPAASWANVATEFRRGLLDQAACSKFATELPVEIPVGIPVTYTDGAKTYTTPDQHFDYLEIVLEFPEGIFDRHQDGDVDAYAIGIKIELRVAATGIWQTLAALSQGGYSFYPIRKTYRSDVTYPGGAPVTIVRGNQYDIRVTKTTGDYTGEEATRHGDDVKLYAVREIIGVGFTYPGRVVMQVSALATKELSGALDVSVEFDGAIVNTDMTGGTTLEDSDNPAHVIIDALTMPVISGDGDGTPYAIAEYRGPCGAADPILATFAGLESYADALVDDGAGGTEKRLAFDGFFDRDSSVGDAVTEICAVSRCHLLWRGNRPYVQIDAARSPVAVLSDGNGRGNGRETLIPAEERASEIEVHYREGLNDYDRTPLLVRNPAVQNNHKVTLQVNGVTKQSRAVRIMNFELKRNQYVTRQLRRIMQFDGWVLEVGDVVYAQRPRYSWGGRLQWVSGRRVRIDRDVRRSASDRIIIQSYNPATESWALESHAARWVAGRLLESADDWATVTPQPGDVFLFGPSGIASDLFEVVNLRRSGDHEFVVDLVTYDARLFDADDTAPVIVADVGVSRAQRGTTSVIAPPTQAQVEHANPPGVEQITSTPEDGIVSLKSNVRLYVDADNVAHLQRYEAGVWKDLQAWGSASSSSSLSSSSSSSVSSSSSSLSSSSSSSAGA